MPHVSDLQLEHEATNALKESFETGRSRISIDITLPEAGLPPKHFDVPKSIAQKKEQNS